MNLIILLETDRAGENLYRLNDNRADHIRSVLRLSAGDKLEVGLLNGPTGRAIVESVSDSAVNLVCRELKQLPDRFPVVDLICALPRPQTLKKILLTCGMMGVRRLFLIRANRVEKSYYQSPLLQPDNFRPYLIEGLSQGKQTRLPEVSVHDRFKPFFE
ncbi:MAG: RsmE family RNA methyltransferase, partial [Candidatus Zixiibacteriota bacterium]